MKNYEEPTMSEAENFEINYWGKNFNNIYQEPLRRGRSARRKLLIVFFFVAVLAVLPIIIFGLGSVNYSKPKIATTAAPKPKPTKTPPANEKEQPEKTETEAIVINNDSYWKISKRVCGTGKYYLSISYQNNGKALYQGERVKVDCNI